MQVLGGSFRYNYYKTNECVYSFSPFNGVTQSANTLSISSAIS